MAERALKSIPAARDEAPGVREPGVREPGVRELPPAAPAAPGPDVRDSSDREKPRRMDRRRSLRWGLFALLPLALLVGGYWYVTGGQVMTTDDAYVDAEKVGISTDVSGIVQTVDVTDNDHVTAGQVLYRLDPRQFQIALDNAKANLAQMLKIRGKAFQILFVGQHGHGLRAEKIVVPNRQKSHQHRQVPFKRRGAEMFVHFVKAGEQRAEIVRANREHRRKADGRVH